MFKFNLYALLGILLMLISIIALFKNLLIKYRDDLGGGINLIVVIITIGALFCSIVPLLQGIQGGIVVLYLNTNISIPPAYQAELEALLIHYSRQAFIGTIAGYALLALQHALLLIKKPVPDKEARWYYNKV